VPELLLLLRTIFFKLLVSYLTGDSGNWIDIHFSLELSVHCHCLFPSVTPQSKLSFLHCIANDCIVIALLVAGADAANEVRI